MLVYGRFVGRRALMALLFNGVVALAGCDDESASPGEEIPCTAPADCVSGICLDSVCIASACDDGVQNGSETGTDCGGSCEACEGSAATCNDGVRNGGETNVDCGGSCPACAAAPSCSDGARNGGEISIDCGGPCAPCMVAPTCADGAQNGDEAGVDCGGACSPCVTCTDGVKNGSESAIDCGGAGCPPCGNALACAADGDCESGYCSAAVCTEPSCEDGVKNGEETDIDCGGSLCAATGMPCWEGDSCLADTDCDSEFCNLHGVCAWPTCDDGETNGEETALDCGGGCERCADGLACGTDWDCVSGYCADALCTPLLCSDGAQNNDETDVDCGGHCGPCASGAACAGGADCTSGICKDNVCAAPTCGDGIKNQPSEACDAGEDNDDSAKCFSDCSARPCALGVDVQKIAHAFSNLACTSLSIPAGVHKEHTIRATRSLSLTGAGSQDSTLDAEELGRLFTVAPGVELRLTGLTLKNGREEKGGAIQAQGDLGSATSQVSLLATDVRFEANQATLAGGAIYLLHASFAATDSQFVDNRVEHSGSGDYSAKGGALYAEQSVVSLQDCLLKQNQVVTQLDGDTGSSAHGSGGGIYLEGSESTELHATDTTFEENSVRGLGTRANGSVWGGAIAAGYGNTIELVRTTFLKNSLFKDPCTTCGDAQAGTSIGGAIAILGSVDSPSASLHIEGSIFEENIITSPASTSGLWFYGGAMFLEDLEGQIVDSSFKNNAVAGGQGGAGGAIYVGQSEAPSALRLDAVTLVGNEVNCVGATCNASKPARGGAVYLYAVDGLLELTLENVAAADNHVNAPSADSAGGFLFAEPVVGRTGVIHVTATNATVSGNTSSSRGGAFAVADVANQTGVRLRFVNATIVYNEAPVGAAFSGFVTGELDAEVPDSGITVEFKNSILTEHASPECAFVRALPVPTLDLVVRRSAGGLLHGNDASCGFTPGPNDLTNDSSVALLPLSENPVGTPYLDEQGSPVPGALLTHALEIVSDARWTVGEPCYDFAFKQIKRDQRGALRTLEASAGCIMGAYAD